MDLWVPDVPTLPSGRCDYKMREEEKGEGEEDLQPPALSKVYM